MSAFPLYVAGAESAARTADHNVEFSPYGGAQGVVVVVVATAESDTASVVFTIQGWDEASDTWYDILASAAVTAVGTTKMVVHPAVTVVANAAAAHPLVPRMRVNCNHDDTDSLTYSVGISLTA